MKSVELWKESDIAYLIASQVEEHLGLDYKAAGALEKNPKSRDDLSKDVSAFANSVGGLLIYGVTEKDHLPEKIDPIDPTVITKEWIEQVINSRIQRRISGVRIFPIKLSKVHKGKVVYVISVPASPDAPHQASDKLYYKRFNFQSIAMEDYEIRDISGRRRHPIVVAHLSLPKINSRKGFVASCPLQISLTNRGRALAEKVYLELQIPEAAIGETTKFRVDSERTIIGGVPYKTYKYYYRDAGGPLPIFPGTTKIVFDGNTHWLTLDVPHILYKQDPSPSITCTVFSDGGESQITTVTLREFLHRERERCDKEKF